MQRLCPSQGLELDLDDAERPVTQDYELLLEPCIYIDASVESKIQSKQIIDLASWLRRPWPTQY